MEELQAPENDESYYEVLGVTEDATEEDIRRAYVRMVRKHRPDQNPELYRRFNQARQILSDPQRRREYDLMRRHGEQIKQLIRDAEAAMEEEPTRAVRLLKQAVAMAPELFLPRYLLALAFLQTDACDDAETQLRRLIQNAPENASLQYNLGGCLKMQGRAEEAIAALQEALRLNPHYHDALTLLSSVYLEKKEVTAALQCLEQAIALDGTEDINDLPVLLQVLTIHVLVDNFEGFQQVQHRIQEPVEPADQANYMQAKLYDLAFDLSRAGNYMDGYKVILGARHGLANDPDLLEAILEATEQIGARADATRLANDPRVPKAMQAFFVWKYLDNEGKLDRIKDRILETLLQEFERSPVQGRTALQYLRSHYRVLARLEAETLAALDQTVGGTGGTGGTGGIGGTGGGQVTVQPVPSKKGTPLGCAITVACAIVGQILIPFPFIGFLVGLLIGLWIASLLKL